MTAKIQPSGSIECHCTALRKASRRLSQIYDDALEGSGLKTTQRAILNQIARSEPLTVRALADAMVLDASALAHTLKPLSRDGLIAIGVDPGDRRNRQIRLTAHGHKMLERTEAGWAEAQRKFEIAVGKSKGDALRDVLEYLVSEDFIAAFSDKQVR